MERFSNGMCWVFCKHHGQYESIGVRGGGYDCHRLPSAPRIIHSLSRTWFTHSKEHGVGGKNKLLLFFSGRLGFIGTTCFLLSMASSTMFTPCRTISLYHFNVRSMGYQNSVCVYACRYGFCYFPNWLPVKPVGLQSCIRLLRYSLALRWNHKQCIVCKYKNP